MAKYKRKVIVVEAEPFNLGCSLPFRGKGDPVQFGCSCQSNMACSFCGRFWVQTGEGQQVVANGDWIIRGVDGNFYPCDPKIFDANYEHLAS